MNINANSQDITELFQAILDSDRLSLIAHLSQQELSLLEISNQSEMHPKEIQRHLDVLKSANLVIVRDHDGKQLYRFNPRHLEQIKRQQFARPKNDLNLDALDLSHEKQKILADYTHQDGSMKMIPNKSKKIIAVLDYLSISFEMDIEYHERQVTNILERFYPDTATLRRYLIDYRYLGRSRNGARYWLIENQESDSRKS